MGTDVGEKDLLSREIVTSRCNYYYHRTHYMAILILISIWLGVCYIAIWYIHRDDPRSR